MVANSSTSKEISSETWSPRLSSKTKEHKHPHYTSYSENPVIESSKFILDHTSIVTLDPEGIENAAQYITAKLAEEAYNPTTWRTQPLHLCPPPHRARDDQQLARSKATLDWIFLISALNFSFWSELEDTTVVQARYGVEWRAGWESDERRVWTGYWSLVAAINRAIENGLQITDPKFYSNEEKCPDSLIAAVFAPATHCAESIPLFKERVKIMREVGHVLCKDFNGSFLGFLEAFEQRNGGRGRGTALQLVSMITETFPSFRDSAELEGRTVFFWKRAQILVAELWAAFYPPPLDENGDMLTDMSATKANAELHPFLPGGVGDLTMFADYRVPQIMHHLRILSYAPSLEKRLVAREPFPHGSIEELAIRAGSILGVEAVRAEMLRLQEAKPSGNNGIVNSVLIDFYLWDLAKRIEVGEEVIEGVKTQPMLPPHRTRSIWY